MAKRSWQMNTTHFPCASINEKALSHFITCHRQHEGMNLCSDKNSAFSLGLTLHNISEHAIIFCQQVWFFIKYYIGKILSLYI